MRKFFRCDRMNKQFEIINRTRKNFLTLVNELTIEQLNTIPPGFNNNIAWNFGHIIASQQVLCFVRSGVVPVVDADIIKNYQRGTRPEKFIDEQEMIRLKGLLYTAIENLENDSNTELFNKYQAFTALYGVHIAGIQDAIQYFAVHDALHYGYSLALKRNIA